MCKHFIVLYGIFTQTYAYYVIFEILAYCKIASANTGCEFCIETFLFNNFCIFINFHILINCYTIQLRKICVCLFSQKPELWKEATLRATITCTTKIVFALHALKMSLMFECVCVCVSMRANVNNLVAINGKRVAFGRYGAYEWLCVGLRYGAYEWYKDSVLKIFYNALPTL